MSQDTEKDIWSAESKQEDIQRVNETLMDLAKKRISMEEAFEYREDGGVRIALPQNPSKMDLETARDSLDEEIENQNATYGFTKFFYCRPPDGAWAFNKVLKELWKAPVGKPTMGFFGGSPPQMMSVKVSPTEEFNVPWGQLYFSPWKTTFTLDMGVDGNYGVGFQVTATGQKKYEPIITGFFMMLEKYVRENSIYAGKSMRGVTTQRPEFYDPYKVDRNAAAYSDANWWELQANIYGLIENADLIREGNTKGFEVVDTDGNPVIDEVTGKPKREFTKIKLSNNVLLTGTNGGGKTMACAIAGQYCLEHGHTFVEAKYDEPLPYVLRFVEAIDRPAVVVIEDVEHLFKNPDAMTALLGEFDGMRSKGLEVTLLMTTNHPEEIPKSLKGGHRIDHTIPIGLPDEPAVKRLIDSHVPASQREELDYSALYEAYEGMMPAFIVRSLEDVMKYSIIRTKKLGQPLATEDFVRAAHALRPSIDAHELATDRPEKPKLETLLRDLVGEVVNERLESHSIDLSDGEIMLNS